ncbi:MAG: sulfate/molybdate ABC transporter ATP-binding protein [Acaryochloris sp. RU_4_1]|nr:sulfate/molybdate ABC transporter ATP-binding protein [Acaryochloris sp. RU_4_1]NJR55285.1 sulfate/molybdate ABC transporter ATP-binding protein [Acaryochloris sp. CRU_2_0]
MSILVENVSKRFGRFQALENINLEIKKGGLVALLGPSGSGKSTLLRVIAGLETPDQGHIQVNGQPFTHLDVRRRNIGFVFQHYALFKHMTVRQNIAFGLKIRKCSHQDIKNRVDELLNLIQLEGLGNRYPSQLSGGQRQRVALARALAVQPQVLLLDEPFGALDAKVRKELRAWLRRLHDEMHVTSVFVTHDQEEAMEVADEIVIMNQGYIEQVGTPAQVYDHPATPFVMSFLGPVNILPSGAKLFEASEFEGDHAELFIRPHDIEVQVSANGATVQATIQRVIHLGWEIQVELRLTDQRVVNAHLSREQFTELQIEPGQTVFIKPKMARTFLSSDVSIAPSKR